MDVYISADLTGDLINFYVISEINLNFKFQKITYKWSHHFNNKQAHIFLSKLLAWYDWNLYSLCYNAYKSVLKQPSEAYNAY